MCMALGASALFIRGGGGGGVLKIRSPVAGQCVMGDTRHTNFNQDELCCNR